MLTVNVNDLGSRTIQIDATAFKWLITNGKIEFPSTAYFDQRVNIQGTSPVYASIKNTTPSTGKEWRIRSENNGELGFRNETNTLLKFLISGEGALKMVELASDAAAPLTDQAVMYTKDNGSGKTQLCVRFNTGAVQILATEP